MKNLLFIPILILSMACDNQVSNEMAGDMDLDFENIIDIPATGQAPAPQESGPEQINQKVVKTGGIDFQSTDIEKDYKTIRQLLPKFKAYLESESQTKSVRRINYKLTIRVPSAVYDTLYISLASIPANLDGKYSNSKDVTERYYDLKARIKTKKILEQRYLKLLDKATEIKDMLEIERNLNQVRTDVERLEGQFNYLSKSVSWSTIDVSFYEVLPYVYDSPKRKGYGARILTALDSGWQGLLSVVVGLTSLWPFILLVVSGIYLFKKIRPQKK